MSVNGVGEETLKARPEIRRPFTYVIEYEQHLDEIEYFVSEAAEAPPHMVHTGSLDTPLVNAWGAAFPVGDDPDRLADAAETQHRLTLNRQLTDGLHAAGVKWALPYVCNQTLAGNRDLRSGIWSFFDHWDEYGSLDLGPPPPCDPDEWMARDRDGGFHFNYETRHKYFEPWNQLRYAPCANNPHYGVYLRAVVRLIARAGYDGVFVDNCILNCFCDHCQKSFREHVSQRYSADERKELLGWGTDEDIQLAHLGGRIEFLKDEPLFGDYLKQALTPEQLTRWLGTSDMSKARVQEGGNGWLWSHSQAFAKWCRLKLPKSRWPQNLDSWGIKDGVDRLRWAETKRSWAESVKRNLETIRAWGLEEREEFLILPNWGSMRGVDGHLFRENIGHDFATWEPASDWQMWEEDGAPGMLAEGVYAELTTPFRFAQAAGGASAAISAHTGNEACCALAFAEAGANGGSFIQPGWGLPHLRREWRDWLDNRPEMYDGLRSAAEVGIVFSAQAVQLQDTAHLDALHPVSRWLCDQQIPFDFLVNNVPDFAGYSVVMVPAMAYVADEFLDRLTEYLDDGGIVVVVGDIGDSDQYCRPRGSSPIGDRLNERPVRPDGMTVTSSGAGLLVHLSTADLLCDTGETLSLDDVWQLGRVELEPLQVGGATPNRYHLIHAADQALGIQRFQQPGPLSTLIKGRLGQELSVADPVAASGLRVWPYLDLDGTTGRLVVHLLNYRVPLTEDDGARNAQTLRDVELTLPVPLGWTPESVLRLGPGQSELPLNFAAGPSGLRLSLQEVNTYAVLETRLRRVG